MKIEDDTLNFTQMFRRGKELSRIKHHERVIVSGMGGSGIGGNIASALCHQGIHYRLHLGRIMDFRLGQKARIVLSVSHILAIRLKHYRQRKSYQTWM